MTGNISYLLDFEKINRGYVSFSGNPKGGKITSKGKIKTSKLDFDDVYFVKELKFNLFSVSQMCDKNNNVLFTNTECIALSSDFKLSNDNHKFCGMKGIKREFSVARTPQQNGVAERKNMTLIEATRTMLSDLLLPILFLAEAVNTVCYVQNRVLLTKPHNKTHYELLLGRTPSIGFIRPFGCPVTILNTLDPLGKFNGKADEGFLVGYFSINYQPVDAGNQPNSSTSIQDNFDEGTVVKEAESAQQYVLLPLCINKVNAASAPVTAVGPNSTNSTNSFSVAGPSNTAISLFEIGRKSSFVDPSHHPDDPNMPALEDIIYSDDEEDVGAEADFSNSETSIIVSPIPTTRVHKDYPVTQIIGDLSSTPQTRSMGRMVKEQGRLTQINDEDFHTCMLACFLSQEETKRGHTQEKGIDYEEFFAPVARIEAIRLFLAYASFMGFMVYKMDVESAFLYETIKEEVYVCQPLGFEDPDYPDKVYKVVKALYGLHQAPKAWYETLANYLLKNGFQREKINQTLFIKKQKGDILLVQVYVDDIIFGSTKKELCKAFDKLMKDKSQMSSMGELSFFLGLQVKQKDNGIFISQDKYVAKILRKFGLTDGKSASTHIDTKKPLLKDPDGEDVDVYIYRSMIGSLMYHTSSRPDIMFVVCACARFQVTPKVSHLHTVKRIFRYLKGKQYLGLWYPKDSPFNLVGYSNSDYAGASLDRKSITGGCQFLGCRLISWQCKKQIVVVTLSTEAEYIAAANCCAQVLWIQNQLLDYGYNFMLTMIYIDNSSTICIIKNPVLHSKTKHIEIRHHFIRDCNDKKLIQVVKIPSDNNFADLLTKAFDVGRFQYLVLKRHTLDRVFLGFGLTMQVKQNSMKFLEWTLHVTNVSSAG
nr:putative ribonuclease H-like domain-containing protein [Tanacetum cinerariifolium]